MTKACVKTSGTSTTKGASVLFFGFHWSFTILEPSGKGWPLAGTPALYASIMVGLATITLSTSSVRAEETTAQSSYPLKSENAIPLGDFSEYLSCAALISPKAASNPAIITEDGILVMARPRMFLTVHLANSPMRLRVGPKSNLVFYVGFTLAKGDIRDGLEASPDFNTSRSPSSSIMQTI